MSKGISFDVATLLGIGAPDATPLPEAADGEIVLRVPEVIHLVRLRDSTDCRELMHRQTWYARYDWCRQPLAPGVCRLRLLVPDSNRKTFDEQQSMLAEGEEVAPITAAALALLCLWKAGHPDPLNGKWVRCAEKATADSRVGLGWCGGRPYVRNGWDDFRDDLLWVASVRTS